MELDCTQRKDVELAKRKFEDFNIDESIYVVDNRQSLHFKQVFKVLENVGLSKQRIAITYNTKWLNCLMVQ